MRVLLTGGSGFIGRNLRVSLAGRHEVLAPPRAELDLADERSIDRWFADNRVDAVVHAATTPGHRNAPPVADLGERNRRMFGNLLRHADPLRRLVVLGSGAEYDPRHYAPKMPEERFGAHVPEDEASRSKFEIARLAMSHPRGVHLRPFGVYGPHEDWEIRFVSNCLCKALFDLPLTLKRNRRFDYVWVDDLAPVIDHLLAHDPKHRDYNVTPDRAVELREIAELVLTVTGKRLPIVAAEPGLGPEYSGDNRRLRAEIPSWSPTPLREGIARLWSWYQENRASIRPEALKVDK